MRSTNRRAPRAHRLIVRTGLLLSLALVLAACSGDQSVLTPAGPYAQKPDDLFRFVFWIAVVVFVLVQGLIIFTAVKFRARRGDDTLPVQTHGNTRLEIFWTVIPALILAGIAVPTIQQIFELDEQPEGALTVEVVGHRWWWEFRYPDYGITTANEVVVPVGTPIRFEMTANDPAVGTGVIHSFWIPAWGGKQDVIPGRVVTLNLQADVPGRYIGMCTEYCGLSHANMRQRGVALPQDEFEQWVADQQKAAAQPEEGSLAATGRDLILGGGEGRQLTCVGCHNFRQQDVDAATSFASMTGPDLTHLLSRKEFAGAIFDLYRRDADGNFTDEVDVEQLRAWLRDAPSQKAMEPAEGYSMPSFSSLPDEELDAVLAYLLTLE